MVQILHDAGYRFGEPSVLPEETQDPESRTGGVSGEGILDVEGDGRVDIEVDRRHVAEGTARFGNKGLGGRQSVEVEYAPVADIVFHRQPSHSASKESPPFMEGDAGCADFFVAALEKLPSGKPHGQGVPPEQNDVAPASCRSVGHFFHPDGKVYHRGALVDDEAAVAYSGTRNFDKSGVACYAPPACIRLPQQPQHGGLPCPENVELLRRASKATSS